VRDQAFPDLPDVDEVYTILYKKKPAGAAWEAYKAFNAAAFAVQKILWVKKEAPADSIKAVLEAVDRLQTDSEFQKKAADVLGGYPVLRVTSLRQPSRRPTILRLRPGLRSESAEDQVQHRGQMIGTSILWMTADL